MGIRDILRDYFSSSIESKEWPKNWIFEGSFVNLLAADTWHVLGYRPDRIERFLGLPVQVCSPGEGNRLVTENGWIIIAQPMPHND